MNQILSENQYEDVSHCRYENQTKNVNHFQIENQTKNVKLNMTEDNNTTYKEIERRNLIIGIIIICVVSILLLAYPTILMFQVTTAFIQSLEGEEIEQFAFMLLLLPSIIIVSISIATCSNK